MRMLRLLFLLLFLSGLCSAQIGTWTLYYSENDALSSDGSSVVITPTVSISGSTNAWCLNSREFASYTAAVMLNGNPWAVGQPTYAAGARGTSLSYTFPSVTVAAGGVVDMSYAGKVEGDCFKFLDLSDAISFGYVEDAYDPSDTFVDGFLPDIPPTFPCAIDTSFYPDVQPCSLPWPPVWASITPYPIYSADIDSQQVAQVIATPTNFQLGPGTADPSGNGYLDFNSISWQSSSGNLSDLSACVVGEYVTYPGTGNFVWPSPPYQAETMSNPTIINIAATEGGCADVHSHPAFQTPYAASNFNSAQQYRWSCSNWANGQWFNFSNYTISRGVNQHPAPSNAWYYLITKAGYSASVDPLP